MTCHCCAGEHSIACARRVSTTTHHLIFIFILSIPPRSHTRYPHHASTPRMQRYHHAYITHSYHADATQAPRRPRRRNADHAGAAQTTVTPLLLYPILLLLTSSILPPLLPLPLLPLLPLTHSSLPTPHSPLPDTLPLPRYSSSPCQYAL